MFNNFKKDIQRYIKKNIKENVYLLFEQGLWAIAVYRFGRWVRKVRFPIVSMILRIIAFLLFKIMEVVTGISLPASAQIGKGLLIGHFGATILHSDVRMGENCSIGTGVIIGALGQGKTGVPAIGNNVFMGTGSKVLGPITIGNNVSIGANAVVVSDVPDGATVVGVPAKIVKKH